MWLLVPYSTTVVVKDSFILPIQYSVIFEKKTFSFVCLQQKQDYITHHKSNPFYFSVNFQFFRSHLIALCAEKTNVTLYAQIIITICHQTQTKLSLNIQKLLPQAWHRLDVNVSCVSCDMPNCIYHFEWKVTICINISQIFSPIVLWKSYVWFHRKVTVQFSSISCMIWRIINYIYMQQITVYNWINGSIRLKSHVNPWIRILFQSESKIPCTHVQCCDVYV